MEIQHYKGLSDNLRHDLSIHLIAGNIDPTDLSELNAKCDRIAGHLDRLIDVLHKKLNFTNAEIEEIFAMKIEKVTGEDGY